MWAASPGTRKPRPGNAAPASRSRGRGPMGASLARDLLRPLLVYPVAFLEIELVFRDDRRDFARHGRELLVRQVEVLALDGRRGADIAGEQSLGLGAGHEVHENLRLRELVRGLADDPASGIQHAAFLREGRADRKAVLRGEPGDV